MEIEFKNPLNVPIVFRFRIAFLSSLWEEPRINPIRRRLLRHITSDDTRTALIDKENNDLDGRILNQENKLTEFGFMEIIEGLLRQLAPISKEKDLPWEQAKDKKFLESVYLPIELRIKLFFYILISHYVDLLDKGGEKRIKYFENANLGNSDLSEGFTYIYTADWFQNAFMIPLQEKIHNHLYLYEIGSKQRSK
uniref:Uncharacterized protein n=1 Tax=Meloidogyne javanica TaxID=6303 RepID=A0A915LPE9_MELJA